MELASLEKLATEGRNIATMEIDRVSTLEMVSMINEEDKKVAYAVALAKESIAQAIDKIAEKLQQGGRLIYMGAGTSGRLGIVDASECPPTFGVDYELVQGIIAGGTGAIFKAVEGAEDNETLGRQDLMQKGLTAKDAVCGIAASGRTPYVIGGMKYAKEVGAAVICISMSPDSEMAGIADTPICVVPGPEVITGSTRMKAGTAQKMVLNMLSTGTMIKLGKVYSNLMVDVKATNKKLVARARKIVIMATGVEEAKAEAVLKQTDYDVKLSILIIMTGMEKEKAKELLGQHKGYIRKVLDQLDTMPGIDNETLKKDI